MADKIKQAAEQQEARAIDQITAGILKEELGRAGVDCIRDFLQARGFTGAKVQASVVLAVPTFGVEVVIQVRALGEKEF